MRLRSVVLVVALCTVVAMTATGTQSFSASELDRGISMNVVSDEEAYLGYAAVVDDEQTLTVDLANRVDGGQTLDVVVEVSNESTSEVNTTTLAPGQHHQFEFTDVSCDATIDVVATGQSVDIELTRSVPCDSSSGVLTDDEGENTDGGGENTDGDGDSGDQDGGEN